MNTGLSRRSALHSLITPIGGPIGFIAGVTLCFQLASISRVQAEGCSQNAFQVHPAPLGGLELSPRLADATALEFAPAEKQALAQSFYAQLARLIALPKINSILQGPQKPGSIAQSLSPVHFIEQTLLAHETVVGSIRSPKTPMPVDTFQDQLIQRKRLLERLFAEVFQGVPLSDATPAITNAFAEFLSEGDGLHRQNKITFKTFTNAGSDSASSHFTQFAVGSIELLHVRNPVSGRTEVLFTLPWSTTAAWAIDRNRFGFLTLVRLHIEADHFQPRLVLDGANGIRRVLGRIVGVVRLTPLKDLDSKDP